jgi:2,3-dihydroxybenzoate-AMP ligase
MLEGCTPFPAEVAERYVRAGFWRRETVPQAIAKAALERPDSIAITDSTRSLTFSQLIAEAGNFAALLSRNGIVRNDRIVIQLPNCIEFATLTIGCLEIGAIPVMALPAFRKAELEYLVSFSDAKAIAIAPEYRGFDHAALARELKISIILSTTPADGCFSMHEHAGPTHAIGSSRGDPFEVALFLLSGGTTGMPKLIPRTHADYLYNARESAAATGLTSKSRILLALPAEHNLPLACPGLLGALLTGARSIFSQSTKAADLADTIEREQITHLPCVPALAIALLDLPQSSRSKLASLQIITVGGQRLQEPTARALRQSFPHLIVQQVLGMAEGLLCYTRLDELDEFAFATQGRPLSPADEIRIVNADGTDVAAGAVGELWCRGPYTIRGYFRAPDRNREAFTAEGFYRTGDLVRLDPSGNLVVEGRIKDLINRGGEKISAEEIEAHLIAHPAVSAAAVVAMPDPILGERSCAYLSLREGATITLTVMREFLDARGVAQFKWPERIELVHGLPLTNVGKIKKSELRRDISEKLAAERGTLASGAAAPQGKLKHGRRKRNPPAQPPDRETRAQQSHATLPSDHRED